MNIIEEKDQVSLQMLDPIKTMAQSEGSQLPCCEQLHEKATWQGTNLSSQ